MKYSVMGKEEAINYIRKNNVRLVTKIDHEKDGQVDIKFRLYDSKKDINEIKYHAEIDNVIIPIEDVPSDTVSAN